MLICFFVNWDTGLFGCTMTAISARNFVGSARTIEHIKIKDKIVLFKSSFPNRYNWTGFVLHYCFLCKEGFVFNYLINVVYT